MQKGKQYDWKDTNLALFGSDLDRGVKKESAETEKAWRVVQECNEPKTFIWRIEKFKVVPWPEEDYGKFYSGDSYIICNVYKENDALLYDIHFWIGKYSTQDEYGTAAYKTVELDTLMDDRPIQHREVQGQESELFKSYFNEITYLKGGCDSGFRHVDIKEYKPRLLHFKGEKRRIVVTEVKASRNNLDPTDVFILDLGNVIYQWNGTGANKDERFKAAQYLRTLSGQRHGKASTEVVDEDGLEHSHEFYTKLSDAPCHQKSKDQKDHGPGGIYRLSDASGDLKFDCVQEGSLDRSKIDEDDVYIVDNGEIIYVYVGQNASTTERYNAMAYAHNYLKDQCNNPLLPVTVINPLAQGRSKRDFEKVFAA